MTIVIGSGTKRLWLNRSQQFLGGTEEINEKSQNS
jgi:hypothetical protein